MEDQKVSRSRRNRCLWWGKPFQGVTLVYKGRRRTSHEFGEFCGCGMESNSIQIWNIWIGVCLGWRWALSRARHRWFVIDISALSAEAWRGGLGSARLGSARLLFQQQTLLNPTVCMGSLRYKMTRVVTYIRAVIRVMIDPASDQSLSGRLFRGREAALLNYECASFRPWSVHRGHVPLWYPGCKTNVGLLLKEAQSLELHVCCESKHRGPLLNLQGTQWSDGPCFSVIGSASYDFF